MGEEKCNVREASAFQYQKKIQQKVIFDGASVLTVELLECCYGLTHILEHLIHLERPVSIPFWEKEKEEKPASFWSTLSQRSGSALPKGLSASGSLHTIHLGARVPFADTKEFLTIIVEYTE